MNCPACSNTLTEVSISDIKLDVCKNGCGGIWFDSYELKKLDEPHEHTGCELLDIPIDESINIDQESRRNCPRCEEAIVMLRHFSSVKREIEVDECGNCGGFWLDHGELNNLRGHFKTEEERSAAAKKYIGNLCNPILEAQRQETRDKLNKSKEVVSMFKFICPSYYVPGEQDYGAF